jgi:hypothetical protein
VICALIALVALGDLAIRAAVRLEIRWDTFWYHVPFAAVRGGLPIPYDMSDTARIYYEGFPPLPDLVQGILWRLTGSLNATGVANYIAFAAFLGYCHLALRARFWLVALISLTAPMVLIHTTVSYVDLFGNALLAIGLSSCLYLFVFPERPSRLVTILGLAGLVGAAWSKFQLVPIVGVGFCFFGALTLLRTPPSARFSRRSAAALFLAAVVVATIPYAKNFVVYGNPFWPIRLPVVGDIFPWALDAIGAIHPLESRPPPLRDSSQVALFVNSLFEIGHPTEYASRARWTIDQGNAWIAFRMGGFWVVGVVTYLLATIAMLLVYRRKVGILAGVAFIGTLCFVAFLPQSHELRYYQFIPLTWAAAIGMLFPYLRATFPKVALAFLVVVSGLFVHMVAENKVHYEITRIDYAEAAREWGATQWWPSLQRGPTYCAVDMVPIGILLTGPTMSEYKIVDRSRVDLCPDGSTVIVDGRILGPRGAGAP